MVLDEHEVTVVVFDHLGEIALVGARTRQCFDTRAQRAPLRDRPAIRRELGLHARVDHRRQPVLAECAPDRIEEIDGEIVVMVGEEVAREIGERPHVSRAGRAPRVVASSR